jgi:hypothetical protein
LADDRIQPLAAKKEVLVKIVTKRLLLILLLAPWSGAHADAAAEVCASLRAARIHLIALMGATNQLTLDNHAARLHAASETLDAQLAAMRQGRDALEVNRAAEFEPVWRDFKHTRETGIIPAVREGKIETARKLALGVQAERMKTMQTLMGCKR